MVAKRGTKRVANAEAEAVPAAKKRPLNAQEKMLEGISSALGGSENLAPETKDMLVSMVDGSLSTTKDERHRYQTVVVDMIGDALSNLHADMAKTVAAENEKLTGAETSKVELEAAREKALELVAAKMEASKQKKAVLVEHSLALSKAKQELTEAQEVQRKGDAAHVAATKECAAHESTMADSFAPLKAGGWENDAEAKQNLEALMPIVEKIDLEESLVTSLPTACLKQPAERGPFDNMVFEELEKIFDSRLVGLRVTVAEGAPAAAERAAVVQAAQASVDSAKVGVQASAAALNAAQAEEKEHEAALKAAEHAVKDFAPNFRKATQARDLLVSELEGFEEGPLASYKTLKERIAKKAAVEESVPVAPEEVVEA